MIENPFSTRFVNPMSCSFVDPEHAGSLLEENVDLDCPGIAQIVGPHGCGKSTLAFHLANTWKANGEIDDYQSVVIRGSQVLHNKYKNGLQCRDRNAKRLLIVDGIESLSWLNRTLFMISIRKPHFALLITTHKRICCVPVLCEIMPCLTHFQRIVQRLQIASDDAFNNRQVAQAYYTNDGDYRAALMQLYDEWELQRRK